MEGAPRSMRCVDVNVLVNAHRTEAPSHAPWNEWLESARVASEPLGVASLVLSGFLRVVTHSRVFGRPTTLSDALAFAEALRSSPSVVEVVPGERHWSIFSDLCTAAGARGNLVPDAYLAALAIESGAVWVTADRGFARFSGLRVEHPVD